MQLQHNQEELLLKKKHSINVNACEVGYRVTVLYGLFAKGVIRSDLNCIYSTRTAVIRSQI